MLSVALLSASLVVACVAGRVMRAVSDRYDVPRWTDDDDEDDRP